MPPDILSKAEYQQLLQNPSIYLTDPRIRTCQVEKDPYTSLPKARSGGLALTYQITINQKKYALRCFHKIAQNRESHYQSITKFLTTHPSTTLIKTEFQPQGIRYQDKYYPITLMEWIEGESLGTYLFRNINNRASVQNLLDKFQRLVQELERLQIAHGDLSHSNIFISSGNLVLIDYDGMFVPDLKGRRSMEIGNINFQHPTRSELHFDSTIDHFSEILIFLALKALTLSPALYQKYGLGTEGLLFKQSDFIEPNSSKLIADLEQLPSLLSYVQNFKRLCHSSITSIPALRDFIENRPIEVTNIDYKEPVYSLEVGSWPLDATDIQNLLRNETNSVVVIGRIDRIRKGFTWNGDPYVFLNVGIWPKQSFTIVIWSNVLELLKAAGRQPDDFEQKWISVSGVISIYTERPQIVLESPADIAIITEIEAKERLNNKKKIMEKLMEREMSRPIEHPITASIPIVTNSSKNLHSAINGNYSQVNKPVDIPQQRTSEITNTPSSSSHLPILSSQQASPLKSKVDVAGTMNKIYGGSDKVLGARSTSTNGKTDKKSNIWKRFKKWIMDKM